eukprot:559816-Amphidinium_carterae.2
MVVEQIKAANGWDANTIRLMHSDINSGKPFKIVPVLPQKNGVGLQLLEQQSPTVPPKLQMSTDLSL